MRWLRRRGPWIVAFWLVGQTASAAALSSAVCGAASADAPTVCTCSHADGGECPMHHTRPAPASRCSCRSSGSDAVGAMLALFGPSAIMPPASGAAPLVPEATVAPAAPAARCHRPSVPDPPPPRRPLL